jgi:DNA helicase-2/ATP-dependent DNA helicase PcrA
MSSFRMPALTALLTTLDADQSCATAWEPKDGNLRVVASAGSGKTRVVTALASRLVADDIVPPERIVVTTFSNRASKELASRMSPLLMATQMGAMRVGTFHSLALKALRTTTVMPVGAWEWIQGWSMQRCLDVSAKTRAPGIPTSDVLWRSAIQYGRMPGTNVESLKLDADPKSYSFAVGLLRAAGYDSPMSVPADERPTLSEFDEAWTMVLDAKRALEAWDFSDALAAWRDGLKEGTIRPNAEVVIVDEAQDNNRTMLDIARGLLVENGRIVLVGDGRQCIFSFNGAYPEMFYEAETRLGAGTRQIRTNYRSRSPIVDIGNRVAEGRTWSIGDAASAHRGLGGESVTVEVLGAYVDAEKEAETIATRIRNDIDTGVDPSSIAVLCRTNAQLGIFQAALTEVKVPCIVIGTRSLFDHREVQTVLGYCVLSQLDAVGSLEKVANFPKRYLGSAFIAAVKARMVESKRPLDEAIRAAMPSISPGSRRGAMDLLDTIRRLRRLEWVKVPDAVLEIVTPPDRKGTSLPSDEGSPDEDRPGLYRAAATIARRFDGPVALVDFADRCNANTAHLHEDADAEKGRVTLSTIHKSKSREWNHVYLQVDEGALPHWRSLPRASLIEDEARLFYVAVTRARDRLTFTWSNQGHGPRGLYRGPSRFLKYVNATATTP